MSMTLRNRLLLSLLLVFALTGICQYLIGQWLIYPRFLDLERSETTAKVEHAAQALEHELDQLLPSVSDWAAWDETYRFAQDANPSFAAANLKPSVLTGLTINLLAIYDQQGQRLGISTNGLDSEDQQALADIAPEQFSVATLAFRQAALDQAMGQFVWSPHGLFLVGYRAIVKNSGAGPPMGTLVMARLLDDSALARLGSQLGVNMHLSAPRDRATLPPGQALGALRITPVQLRKMPESIAGQTTLLGADGQPMVTLSIQTSREIVLHGREAMWLAGLSLALAGALVLVLFMGLLHRLVMTPLSLLTAHAIALGKDHELNTRLELGRSDEIGVLADAFNRMMESLSDARQQLLERLGAHMDNSPLAVIELDANWRIMRWSGDAEHLFGWQSEDVLGCRLNEVEGVFPDDQDLIEMPSADKLLGNPIHWSQTRQHLRKDGAWIDCTWYNSALFDQTDKLISLLVLIEDITERKRAENIVASHREQLEQQVAERTRELELSISALASARDQAEAANQAKSAFLATMSHEIRTPMNAVLGLTELLGSTSLDDQQRRFVDNIHRSGEALLDVINDILDFSKIEAGKLTLESHDFDPRKLLDETVQLFTESAHSKGLQLTARLPRGLPAVVYGDSMRLRQILVNLIGNAVKFTDQGEIQISASATLRADEQIILAVEVQDTGAGIPPDMVSKIFDAFAQADGSTTRQHGGTGLGLTICRQLAQLMGGTIRVDSTPGQGTRFALEVPFTSGQDQSPPQPQPIPVVVPPPAAVPVAAAPPTWLSGRVLLVEDNAVNREMAILMLEGLGLNVITASNGAEALRLIEQEQAFTLILMDCHMPVMDGFSATAAIRAWETQRPAPSRRAPIIALTANVEKGIREQCAAAGMDGYLSKPFSQMQLAEAMMPWIAPHEAPIRPAPADSSANLETLNTAPLDAIRSLQQPGQPDPLEKIIRLYLENAPKLIEQSRRALTDAAAEDLRQAAHTLKAATANLGGDRLAALCRTLEQQGRDSQLQEAATTLVAIEREFALFVAALNGQLPAKSCSNQDRLGGHQQSTAPRLSDTGCEHSQDVA